MSTPLTSVVVPVYYCDPSLYGVITRSIASLDGQHVIMVDDASPIDHDFMNYYNVVYLRNEENRGFTATVNRGLRVSVDDIVVVMNDDVVMTEECMDRFRSLEGLVIASPMDTSASDDDRFGSCWGMTRETYELLGPLNEEYRHFYSDTDYYERAKAAGVEIIKWKDITLDHPESSTYKLVDKESLLAADAEKWEARV